MRITKVEAERLRVPLPRPVTVAGGQDAAAAKEVDLVLVRLMTDGPHTGLGFSYGFGCGGLIQSTIESLVAPVVVGDDPARIEWLFLKAAYALSSVGFTGLVARAYAAVDFALWDLKGRAANLPVHQLLGGYRTKLKAIAADTATPALGAKQAVKETRALLDRGAAGVQIEVGTQDPDVDLDRLRMIVEGLPEGPWLEVNAAGRYDFATARAMGRAFDEEYAIDGFLDPLRAEDFDGLKRLSDVLDVGLGVGYDRVDDYLRAMEIGGLSTLRIDPLRLGGLTPARKLAHAAELRQIAISPVRLPEIGAHLAAGVVYGRVCEYVDWFADVFTGGPRFESGQLVVPDAPGFGIEVKTTASRYRV